MSEYFETFLELILDPHFQRVLYSISLILLIVIAIGALSLHGYSVQKAPLIESDADQICSCLN